MFWTATSVTGVIALGVGLLLWRVASRAPGATGVLYRVSFRDTRRERLFLAALGFFVAFAVVRAITHAIHDGLGPFRDVAVGATHVHHLVWGILLLLGVGYCWLIQVGTGSGPSSRLASRATAFLYGVGAALTLDEFALWLHLEDVYWSREGRESIDAVVLYGTVLALSLVGGPFFRALLRRALLREAGLARNR